MTAKSEREKGLKYTAANKRFHAMAGVAPHKRQCELASFVPARTVVSPPLREAATTLSLSVKPTAQMAHLVFPTHIANTKPKEPFFPTHYNIIQKRLLTSHL